MTIEHLSIDYSEHPNNPKGRYVHYYIQDTSFTGRVELGALTLSSEEGGITSIRLNSGIEAETLDVPPLSLKLDNGRSYVISRGPFHFTISSNTLSSNKAAVISGEVI